MEGEHTINEDAPISPIKLSGVADGLPQIEFRSLGYLSWEHTPNPPKLDVLDLATSVSGKKASSISRSRRTRLCAIDVPYALLDCVGREGSCRVYRIIAENNDVFTLKRANLRDVNEATVRRNRSEIDQLKKLAKVDRSSCQPAGLGA
ncbi:uncharacterized protein PADG_11742 [Paracoccidioides brasiliensis Pb18]|uniref:Uncharacterized protein n=1 Tax=Paracoccidioides brasiliensis (strain Pb18) TaxID=502780 RepID=A0A0A0HSN7_PARBD|nr:uncharacterized protein PADG_11742 [Paracoccidioides brasiliensis Pb18]KGM92204.1 hypothetical protein PADG_11742 [Paracoccidioides brasiliensis Pb18]